MGYLTDQCVEEGINNHQRPGHTKGKTQHLLGCLICFWFLCWPLTGGIAHWALHMCVWTPAIQALTFLVRHMCTRPLYMLFCDYMTSTSYSFALQLFASPKVPNIPIIRKHRYSLIIFVFSSHYGGNSSVLASSPLLSSSSTSSASVKSNMWTTSIVIELMSQASETSFYLLTTPRPLHRINPPQALAYQQDENLNFDMHPSVTVPTACAR